MSRERAPGERTAGEPTPEEPTAAEPAPGEPTAAAPTPGEPTSAETDSGIPVEPLYRPDGGALDYDRDLGDPGRFPFARGAHATMYRGRLWTMRQYAGFGTAEETNRRYHYLLERGQTGLSVAFDLPTQMGYDSDAPMAKGEAGRCTFRGRRTP